MPTASHRFAAAKGSTTARGYGHEHQTDRAAAAREHHPSDPCARCADELGPMGPDLHFDHNGERTGYLGFSHAHCNVVAGAREGARRKAGDLVEPERRDWYE